MRTPLPWPQPRGFWIERRLARANNAWGSEKYPSFGQVRMAAKADHGYARSLYLHAWVPLSLERTIQSHPKRPL
jgi:hypothetical protein